MLSNEVERLEDQNRKLKLAIEKLQIKFEEESGEKRPKACQYCKFYLRHYVKAGNHFLKTGCGHCVHGSRTKTRKPNVSCEYFEIGDHDAERLYQEGIGRG